MRVLRLLPFLLTAAVASQAAEIAQLRNGFTIRHLSRDLRDGGVARLYLDDAKKSFIDVPAQEIESYSQEPDPTPEPSHERAVSTQELVKAASEQTGIDSDFLHSVIKQESSGNTKAVSRAGAQGLMQLMPGTAAQLGVTNSFDPKQNVDGGSRYLRDLLERYHGDAIKALAAYNAGPARVDHYNGVPPIRETRLYVRRIVMDYNRKKREAEHSSAAKPAAKHVQKVSGAS